MGAVSGFLSTAMTFIAAETPKEHSGWAISTISTGGVSGSLLGPLLGGYLSELMECVMSFLLRELFILSFLIVFSSCMKKITLLKQKIQPKSMDDGPSEAFNY